MEVWKSPPVELQRIVFLSCWQVMETDEGSRYFIGYSMETMSGRASIHIVKFDPETRRGVTGSGRIYELVGESGVDTEANHLWAVTCAQVGTTPSTSNRKMLPCDLSCLSLPICLTTAGRGA